MDERTRRGDPPPVRSYLLSDAQVDALIAFLTRTWRRLPAGADDTLVALAGQRRNLARMDELDTPR